MKIWVDSREKPEAIKGILAYFDRHHIEYDIKALKTGDYVLNKHPRTVIDRKHNLSELAGNLLSPDRARFYREIRRARAEGIKLIILCEHGPDIKCIEDVQKWKNPYGKVTGKGLMEAIYRTSIAYGIEFLFCSKQSTGKRIAEILKEGAAEDDAEGT